MYGINLAGGREWMYETGIFLRVLAGVSLPVDPVLDPFDDLQLALSVSMGFKPW